MGFFIIEFIHDVYNEISIHSHRPFVQKENCSGYLWSSLSAGLQARGATVPVGAEGRNEVLHSKRNLVTSNVKLGLQRGSKYVTPQNATLA